MLPTNRPPTHPGEMLLKEFLEPLGVSQVEAARRMKIPFQRLNAIVKGRRGASADTALLFEALTGWDAQIRLRFRQNGTGGTRSGCADSDQKCAPFAGAPDRPVPRSAAWIRDR